MGDDFKFITNVNFKCFNCGDSTQLKSYYKKSDKRCLTYNKISKNCICGQFKVMEEQHAEDN